MNLPIASIASIRMNDRTPSDHTRRRFLSRASAMILVAASAAPYAIAAD